jgi:Ulp1 family protease
LWIFYSILWDMMKSKKKNASQEDRLIKSSLHQKLLSKRTFMIIMERELLKVKSCLKLNFLWTNSNRPIKESQLKYMTSWGMLVVSKQLSLAYLQWLEVSSLKDCMQKVLQKLFSSRKNQKKF